MRVLLVVDDSEESTRAVEAVQRRNWPLGSRALVLAVVPRHHIPPPPPSMWLVTQGEDLAFIEEEDTGHASALVEMATEALAASGLEAEGKVSRGYVRSEILREAHEWSADLIVIGSPRVSRLKRLFRGSPVGTVSVRAPCSVEVVRT